MTWLGRIFGRSEPVTLAQQDEPKSPDAAEQESAQCVEGHDSAGPDTRPHFVRDYNNLVKLFLAQMPHQEAMDRAAGGGDFEQWGRTHIEVLQRHAALEDGMSIVDLGCGSGRTAFQIARQFPHCSYVGIDVVKELLDHAKSISPPQFHFILNSLLSFPLRSDSFDLITCFSVFTHLLHEESYLYLEDAKRILRSGGRIAFSFLEFARSNHWTVFSDTVDSRRRGTPAPHANVLVERNAIDLWAQHLGFRVEGYFDDPELGQTLCVLRKP